MKLLNDSFSFRRFNNINVSLPYCSYMFLKIQRLSLSAFSFEGTSFLFRSKNVLSTCLILNSTKCLEHFRSFYFCFAVDINVNINVVIVVVVVVSIVNEVLRIENKLFGFFFFFFPFLLLFLKMF
jgi:hypothetical protein